MTDVTVWPITSNPNPSVLKIEKCKIKIKIKIKHENKIKIKSIILYSYKIVSKLNALQHTLLFKTLAVKQ